VLASAVAGNTRSFSPTQLSAAAAAFAYLRLYSEPALLSICKAATRSLKYWPKSDLVSLLTSLVTLRFRDEPLMRVAVTTLTAAAAAAAGQPGGPPGAAATAAAGREQLSVDELADSLAALLQLGFSGQQLQGLLEATLRCGIVS
jgi:hypothetical protein